MKAIITKLDFGYTVSVDLPAQGELPAEKRRFAFESRRGMMNYINELFPQEAEEQVQPQPEQQRADV